MPERLTIIGGSVAGLVAALEAGRRGQAVDLYLDPSHIGGSFAGIEANGRRLDIGSRLFELDYENAEAQTLPIALLDPARHRRRI